jgi:hypothetical protein
VALFAFVEAANKCFPMESYATTHPASSTVASSSTNNITILHCEPDDAPTATTSTKIVGIFHGTTTSTEDVGIETSYPQQ